MTKPDRETEEPTVLRAKDGKWAVVRSGEPVPETGQYDTNAAAWRAADGPDPSRGERVATVAERNGRFVLIEGKDEFAAWKLVGAETAPVHIVGEARQGWRTKHLHKTGRSL